MRRGVTIGAIVAVCAAGALAGVWALVGSGTPVEAIRAERRDVREYLVASGRLHAPRHSALGPEVPGVVDAVLVEAGDEPHAGDVLVTLRYVDAQNAIERERAALHLWTTDLERLRAGPTAAELDAARANVARAEAEIDSAEAELARAEALLDEGLETPANVDAARTRLAQARADLDREESRLRLVAEGAKPEEIRVGRARVGQARVNLDATRSTLDKYEIVAPFDGLVTRVAASPGEAVSPAQHLVELARMSDAEIYVEVDEDYLDRVRGGQPGRVTFRSDPSREFTATLSRIGPEVDTERGVVGLHLRPHALPNGAFPGLTADVSIEIGSYEGAVAVPVTAVVSQAGSAPYVLVVQGRTAEKREVALVGEGEEWAAITGIEPGTVVVLEAAKIDPGTRIDAREVGANGSST